jgi:ribose transport system substrate-binding protein
MFIIKKVLFTTLFLLGSVASEAKLDFYFITKSGDLPFFAKIKEGCVSKAKELGVNCHFVHFGEANVYLQFNSIKEAISKKADGIALAVIDSKYSSSLLEKMNINIPLITIDADFSKSHSFYNKRDAYVGSNNFDLGVKMGEYYTKLISRKDEYCVIGGYRNSSNLKLRYEGFMSIVKKFKNLKQLERCPLYSNERPDLALFQMNYILRHYKTKPSSIILLGGWPQTEYEEFIKTFKHLKSDISQKKINILSIDSTVNQLRILNDGLSTVNIGQDPFQMGEKAIESLLKIHKNKKLKSRIIYTDSLVCTPSKNEHCK